MSKSMKFSRLGVLAPAALSACVDASVLAAPAAGAILSTVMKELSKAFMLKNWFHGVMSAKEAEQLLLQRGRNGSYLVRESQTHPGDYVLSIRVRARVTHVMIRKEHNRYNVGSGELFDDLTGLIEHCRAYPLTESSGEVLRLRQPVSGTRFKPTQEKTKKMSEYLPQASVQKLKDDLERTERCWLEYKDIENADDGIKYTTIEGSKPENRPKNRYYDVIPYDQTRVPIPPPANIDVKQFSNYINANYMMTTWNYEIRASQLSTSAGPLMSFSEFWRLQDGPGPNWQIQASGYNEDIPPSSSINYHNEDVDMDYEDHESIVDPNETEESRRKKLIADGIVVDKVYIATQGPLFTTRYAFWSMIADNDVRVIAMLADIEESDMTLCHKYWPKFGECLEIGDLQITNCCEFKNSFYIRREFELVTVEKNTKIFHYQFLGWLDHMIPDNTVAIRRLIHDINERMRMISESYTSPGQNVLCVHCSAGVGRTGTFIALDILMDLAKIKGTMIEDTLMSDIPQVVKCLRKQRPRMVQTCYQYQFIYDTMLDHINEMNAMNE